MENLHGLSIANFKAIVEAYENSKNIIVDNRWAVYVPIPHLEMFPVSAEGVTRQPFAKVTFVRDGRYDWVLESIVAQK